MLRAVVLQRVDSSYCGEWCAECALWVCAVENLPAAASNARIAAEDDVCDKCGVSIEIGDGHDEWCGHG